MPDSPDSRLDRYLAGELSAPEQRELARAALGDPELFDVLTVTAAVKATLLRENGPEPVPAVGPEARSVDRAPLALRRTEKDASVSRFKKTYLALTLAGAAAVGAFVLVHRPSSGTIPPPTAASSSSSGASSAAAAVADSTGARS